ncbi:pentapeptide repeat-containing protein [Chitinophaga oryzae]|uniref:Pentapeptide repeat-containing protein n=1 Tax=Chitinophaga oryzae TaxID=2725414 RepID=A0AAE7D796_9BACT|nr:pentapeptide repeat-containing protein [Chitinophaga oryzae]QJB31484.1 pentapeptide repeat-containing protein [Chitinophaga oryzae]QJB37965.1 pentapeptide repeat-containing protein [Chitinophaga oryzae]
MDIKIIGSKIARARKQADMSQAQLAQLLFISPQAVGKWERGESIPDIITMNRLAQVLGVDLNYFSEGFPSAAGESDQPLAESTAVEHEPKRAWDMSLGNWVDADFSGLKHLHEKFSSSNMQRCRFIGSDMAGLLLKGNHVSSCDFSGSDMSGSHFQKSHIDTNLFKECSLREAEFSGSHIKSCNFSGADFTGASFHSASCAKNTMTNAVLNRTSFVNTSLADMVFEGSTLEDCYFDNCSFSRVTFQDARLFNTFFKCKTLKPLRFVNCEADRMTYEFLKNGKADMSGITLITL